MDEFILANNFGTVETCFLVVMVLLTLEVIPMYYKILNVGAFNGRDSF